MIAQSPYVGWKPCAQPPAAAPAPSEPAAPVDPHALMAQFGQSEPVRYVRPAMGMATSETIQ